MKKIKNTDNDSLMISIVKDYKRNCKRLFILLILVLCFWLITIGGFLYYITHYTYEEDYRKQSITNSENIKDTNIINGDKYGNNKTSKKN